MALISTGGAPLKTSRKTVKTKGSLKDEYVAKPAASRGAFSLQFVGRRPMATGCQPGCQPASGLLKRASFIRKLDSGIGRHFRRGSERFPLRRVSYVRPLAATPVRFAKH